MTSVKPEISEYFSNLAKKRKNPYTPFSDPKVAKAASDKGAEGRRKYHAKQKALKEQQLAQSQNPSKSSQEA